MTETRTRRWPIRCAKLSPVIAVVVISAIVVSVPVPFPWGVSLFLFPFTGPGVPGSEMETWVDTSLGVRASEEAHLTSGWGLDQEEGTFAEASIATWERVNAEPDALVSGTTIKSAPFGPDDAVFDPIAEWERANDATVWAWTALAVEMPPIAASARGRGNRPIQPLVMAEPPYEDDPRSEVPPGRTTPAAASNDPGTIGAMLWDELHYTDAEVPALDGTVLTETGSVGSGTGDVARLAGSIVADGTVWRCITVFSLADPNDPAAWPVIPPELTGKSPRDADYDAWLATIAKRYEMDVWIYGPIEMEAVPLRVPAGHDAAQAEDLGSLVWPSLYLDSAVDTFIPVPTELDAATAAVAGGPVGAMTLTDYTRVSSYVYPTGGGIMPQSIAYLVVFDEMPVAPVGPLRLAWYSWQRVAGRNYRTLFGVGVGLLLVSVVLAPGAFVVDRRRRILARAAEERGRMHRDAHDKVYNRLSALSKRVAQVSDTTVNGTAGSLAEIAEEIRSTVGELQQILGDDVHHTGSALTSISLHDQLAAVCGAQAARLGIEVVCDVPLTVRQVSPGLGWDLQCIAEEAITNAVRHGGATKVSVKADDNRYGTLTMRVTDNGSGSAVVTADEAPPSSTGLRGMRERLDKHGGTLAVTSDERGTAVTAVVTTGASSASGEA